MENNYYIEKPITINKYLPFAVLYFFFNSFLLPAGLLYTTILTPLFLWWIYVNRALRYVQYFFIFTLPFALIHVIGGIVPIYYARSYALLFTAFVFTVTLYIFLKKCHTLRTIYRKLLLLNFALVIVACLAFFTPWREVFWMVSYVSYGLEKLPRLKMLTYEPSYYCTLLVPVVMYYCLKVVVLRLPHPVLTMALVIVPLVLSFSMGILLGVPIAILLLLLFHIRFFLTRKRVRQFLIIAGALLGGGLLLLVLFYPDNPLFTRIANLFEGRDSSFKGRTVDSFVLAWKVMNEKSILFGVGPGQVKVIGLPFWNEYYHYQFALEEVAIPCAFADTMAVYGIVGALLRLGIEFYFFFRTKVWTNYYRLGLFNFVFIYQFTGSYINNIAEFTIWVLAFTNTFEEFDKKKLKGETATI